MPRRLFDTIDDAPLRETLEQLSGTGRDSPPTMREQFLLVLKARQQATDPNLVDRWLLSEIDQLRHGLNEARQLQTELRRLHDQLTSPPWFTGVFLRAVPDTPPRAVVACQHTLRVVGLAEDVAVDSLSIGDDVLLTHDLNLVLRKLTPSVTRASDVADFEAVLADGRVMLKTHDTPVVVRVAESLDTRQLRAGDRVRWDQNLAMAFERLPRSGGRNPYAIERPTERFEDIGGLDKEIARLKEVVRLHVQHPELVSRYGLKRAGSVTLVGPPGTGKTMLARGLAHWLGETSSGSGSRFLSIKPGALHSMWWGQSEANYREIFTVAREMSESDPGSPVVLFFDEIDSIGLTRSSGTTARVGESVLTSLMAELDGFDRRGNVLIVAATNRREALDTALLRPGRLGDVILEIPRPKAAGARSILERHLPASAPYAADEGDAGRTGVIDSTVSRLFAPNGLGVVATLTFRDGSRHQVYARDLVNGAMLANIGRSAVEQACIRELRTGETGIRTLDVLDAVSHEVATAVAALSPANCHAHVMGLPQDMAVVRVDATNLRQRLHRYLGAA